MKDNGVLHVIITGETHKFLFSAASGILPETSCNEDLGLVPATGKDGSEGLKRQGISPSSLLRVNTKPR